jgi:hypothetical protein
MRLTTVVVLVAGLGVFAEGCGGTTTTRAATVQAHVPHAPGTPTPPPSLGATKSSPSSQEPTERYDRATSTVLQFGRPASGSEERAIAHGVTLYFAAVAAHRYAMACTLLASDQRVPARGKACTQSLAATFKLRPYRGLDARLTQVVVRKARVRGVEGYAMLSDQSSSSVEAFIAVRRERGVWSPDGMVPIAFHVIVKN